MKIAIVTKDFPPKIRGGGEISAYHLAQALAQLGLDVHVITSTTIEHLRGSKFSLHPIIKNVNLPGVLNYVSRNEIFFISTYRALSKYLFNNPDTEVVHAMNMDSIPGAVLSAKRHDIPSLITVNSHWLTCPTGYMLKSYAKVCNGKCSIASTMNCHLHSKNLYEGVLGPLYAPIQMRERIFFAKQTDAIVCVSENIKSYVKKKTKTNIIYTIPDIVYVPNYETIKLLEKTYTIILFVGALGKFKGCEFVIKAIPEILKEHPDCILRIIGTGERYEEFLSLSKKLGVEQSVVFEGFIPMERMPSYYAASDIVVFPSVVPETFGRVAAEAMAAGKPVVASNVGGIPETVDHMETGILVEPKDSRQIAEAVNYLLDNPKIMREMGSKAKKMARERYAPSAIAKKYLNVYERLVR